MADWSAIACVNATAAVAPQRCEMVQSDSPHFMTWRARWEASSQHLTLFPESLVPAGRFVRINLYSSPTGSAPIRLKAPSEGTQGIGEDRSLTVSATASKGSISSMQLLPSLLLGVSSSLTGARIQRIPAMIDNSTLAFISTYVTGQRPLMPGGGTKIMFSFTPAVSMATGDVLTLHLPEFDLMGSGVVMSLKNAAGVTVLKGQWVSADTPLLTMTVQQELVQYSRVTVNVPSESGIVLPSRGVVGVVNGADTSTMDVSTEKVPIAMSASISGVTMSNVPLQNVEHVVSG
jgi:hypothetical protein